MPHLGNLVTRHALLKWLGARRNRAFHRTNVTHRELDAHARGCQLGCYITGSIVANINPNCAMGNDITRRCTKTLAAFDEAQRAVSSARAYFRPSRGS